MSLQSVFPDLCLKTNKNHPKTILIMDVEFLRINWDIFNDLISCKPN